MLVAVFLFWMIGVPLIVEAANWGRRRGLIALRAQAIPLWVGSGALLGLAYAAQVLINAAG